MSTELEFQQEVDKAWGAFMEVVTVPARNRENVKLLWAAGYSKGRATGSSDLLEVLRETVAQKRQIQELLKQIIYLIDVNKGLETALAEHLGGGVPT